VTGPWRWLAAESARRTTRWRPNQSPPMRLPGARPTRREDRIGPFRRVSSTGGGSGLLPLRVRREDRWSGHVELDVGGPEPVDEGVRHLDRSGPRHEAHDRHDVVGRAPLLWA